MSPAPVSHAPALPYAFHTMTLQNPNWNMDTGASSHLANNTGILTSFSNSSIYPSVFVGNGHSIPVTHPGHSFLHTSSKPLHLNHILVIKIPGRLLLRCDSTRDLYLVTQQPSSQTPVVLLSFSSTTWHRRLGHPGDDGIVCDHGGEYDNTRFHELFRQNGIQFWFSCPRTSQSNGKSERMLRTINNLYPYIIFQAHMPPSLTG
ncbi:ribonuclease H-like domain-containing protein [Tanacetum coccineum]